MTMTIDGINKRYNKVVWRKDGEKINPNERRIDIIHDLPKSTSLVIYDVSRADSATYQCILKARSEVECSDLTMLGRLFVSLEFFYSFEDVTILPVKGCKF